MERRSALVPLPSRGLFYNPDVIPVTDEGEIRVMVLTGAEEMAFSGARGKMDVVLDAILRSCLGSDTKPSELISGDRAWILLSLRAHTYGAEYGFRVKCPTCGLRFMHEMDLISDLEITYSDPEDREPFEMILPISGDHVEFRLIRGKDETRIRQYKQKVYQKKNRQLGPLSGDPAERARLAIAITSVNGEELITQASFGQRISYVQALDAKDLAVLRSEMVKVEPGARLVMEMECPDPDCGEIFDSPIQLDAEFFRPTIYGEATDQSRDVRHGNRGGLLPGRSDDHAEQHAAGSPSVVGGEDREAQRGDEPEQVMPVIDPELVAANAEEPEQPRESTPSPPPLPTKRPPLPRRRN